MKLTAIIHVSNTHESDKDIARVLQSIEDYLDNNKDKEFLISIEEVSEIG